MSNVKDIDIEARVPFTWLDIDGAVGGVTAADAAFVARLLLTPSMGLKYEYASDGDEPNAKGGRTAMYRLLIDGQEALRYETVEHLLDIICRAGGSVVRQSVVEA